MITYPWSDLSDSDFEELCKDLLNRKGFVNVDRLAGPGSGDSGRDIHAEETIVSLTGKTYFEKIFVQAKNYAGSRKTISETDIDRYKYRASNMNYKRLLIITSHDLSSPAKSYANEISNNPLQDFKIDFWNESDLVNELNEQTSIQDKYFKKLSLQFPFRIGVLDGYIENPDDEAQPTELYTYTKYSIEQWIKRLSIENKFVISGIHANEMSSRFDAVINPFGEVYPEEDNATKKTYNKIKEYVHRGGLFINTGGYPFFYSWQPLRNRKEPSVSIRRLFSLPNGQMVQGISFSDTLLARDFNAFLMGGDATEIEVDQKEEDMELVGNIINAGDSNRVIQFRAVIPDTPNCIPLLRNKENTLFPIAAIEYGKGYLIIGGLHMETDSEFEKLALCVQNWFERKV